VMRAVVVEQDVHLQIRRSRAAETLAPKEKKNLLAQCASKLSTSRNC
jgi:hypothetical protein